MTRSDGDSATLAMPPTFDALCRRHGELLELQAVDELDPVAANRFVADAAAAGVQIESVGDRDALRSMINYWTATLARMPAAGAGDEEPGRSQEAEPEPDIDRPTLASFDASQSPTIDESRNPFVGLAAFDVAQSDVFFGRDRVVADLLELVLANSLVVVSGASGTGKSSLVRAGLTAAVRADPERADWTIATAPPGRDPIASLVASLAPKTPDSAGWIEAARARLDADPAQAGALTAERIGEGGLLLIVDQLEELFSLCQPEDRDRASIAIASIAALPRARVVLTLRDEYLEGERANRVLPALDLANIAEFRIPPLDACEIRAAITEPAARAGLVFHDGLIDRIVAEVGTDPAALPLLQYSLLRMWQERQGNRITLAVYEKVGGPATALSNAAQQIYDGFLQQTRENTKIVFQQLVRPSLLYEFVRDRVSRLELQRLLPGESIRTVVRPFVNAGLVVVTPGTDRGQDRIEIAHEALIRNWDPLRRWAGEVRDRERFFLEIDAQAQRWQESGHSPGHLLFLKALKSAEQAQKQYLSRARVDPIASARVERFLAASRRLERRLLGALGMVALLGLILIASLVLQSSSNRTAREKLVRGATEVIAEQEAAIGAHAGEGARDRDAGRQFIQILLTRGVIRPDELPTVFSDMTPIAAVLSTNGWDVPFAEDFLGVGADIQPVIASPPTIRLDLPNLRAFYDSEGASPRLIVSQSDRSAATHRGAPNALYRWPNLPGQLDQVALAAKGLALARLVSQREVGWGSHGANAVRGVNFLPLMVPTQLRGGNRPLRDWSRVTASLRATHNPKASRVLYFTGAVPGPDPYSPPRRLWKVAVSMMDGELVTDAVMLPGNTLNGRATLDQISSATGVDFSRLKAMLASRPDKTPSTTATPSAPAEGPARVYIQYRDVPEEQVTGVRLALAGEGLRTPPVERVNACIPAQVRYYHPEDAAAARRAAAITTSALKEAGTPVSVKVSHFSLERFPHAQRGNLELWFCGSTTP